MKKLKQRRTLKNIGTTISTAGPSNIAGQPQSFTSFFPKLGMSLEDSEDGTRNTMNMTVVTAILRSLRASVTRGKGQPRTVQRLEET